MDFLKLNNLKLFSLILIKIIKRNKLQFLAGLGIIFLVFFLQFKFKLFYEPNSITLGFIGTYQEHDLPQEVTHLLSQGLVESGGDGKVHGKLVSNWETNDIATSFKFKLKNGLKWLDQTPIKASDLHFSIPNTEVAYPDDKTIQFNLKEPYSPLPSLLTKSLFKKNTLVGTGPYRIAKIEKSRIFITKLDLVSDDPGLPKISIRFYPNEKVAVTGFNLGEVQALFGFNNSKSFDNNLLIKIKQKVDYSKIVTILFNTGKDSVFFNRSLRQALAFGAPKIEGEQEANNPYPPFLWAYNPDSKKYLSNPAEAKSALERAKSSLSEDKLKQEIILTTTSNLEPVANKIASSWRELGLRVKTRVEEGIAQNFETLLITQSIPLDPDQYFLWHATQAKTNLTKYDSKRADKDLEDGRKIVNEEERKQKYFDFQRTLLEDAPAVFLYFPKNNIAYLKKKEKVLDKVLSL